MRRLISAWSRAGSALLASTRGATVPGACAQAGAASKIALSASVTRRAVAATCRPVIFRARSNIAWPPGSGRRQSSLDCISKTKLWYARYLAVIYPISKQDIASHALIQALLSYRYSDFAGDLGCAGDNGTSDISARLSRTKIAPVLAPGCCDSVARKAGRRKLRGAWTGL